MKPRIKICCISSVEEARLAMAYGASALGLVGKMPSGPGIITDDLILEIQKTVPPSVATFLLTSETQAAEVVNHYRKVHTSAIQLVDALENKDYQHIRAALPHAKLVQVIHVLDEDSVHEAEELSAHADALLLDSGNPKLAVKVLGGTGNTHNWQLSRKIKEVSKVPVFLAGGIKAENVRRAVETVEPFGIDLCSSVRTDGKLDEAKLEAFFNEIEKL